VVRTEIDVGAGKSVDVYCAHLSPGYDSPIYPYVGSYGRGKTDVEGWIAENRLQTEKLVAYVTRRSPTRAIILAALEQSLEATVDGKVVTNKTRTAPALEYLLGRFPAATPVGYVPACTRCPDHPDLPDALPVWTEYALVKDIPRAPFERRR